MAAKKKSKIQAELEAAGPLGKKLLKAPAALTRDERKALSKILAKARAFRAYYKNTGQATKGRT